VPAAFGLVAVLWLSGLAAANEPALPTDNPFFQSLGANGRACATCHRPDEAWTITPPGLRARFDASDGLDPVFRPADGATCPTADTSTTDARRRAYHLLLAKGLIRITMPVPPHAEFEVLSVDNPYGCSARDRLSVYRRPLPVMNFDVLGAVMWDGRHTVAGRGLEEDLVAQATDALLSHADVTERPAVAQLRALVAFQRELASRGGTRAPADPAAMVAVRRGEAVFRTRIFLISGVGGFNDDLQRPVVVGSCITCHDVLGRQRVRTALLDLGVNDVARRTPDLPVFTLRCATTGQVVRTLDPGRALVTGACRDIGKIKEPVLRALAGRAPYFHNGSAPTLLDVVEFYNARFTIRLSPQEKADLVAFLQTL
jgi:cytochrome c peroxidase